MTELKNIYYRDEFREFAMKKQGVSDENMSRFSIRIKEMITASDSRDPILMFFDIVEKSKSDWRSRAPFPLLGDWHHFAVPGVVLSAMRNSKFGISDKDIDEGIKRADQAKVSCGFTGVCGGANSIGIVSAIVKKVTPIHDDERQEIMRLAVQVLEEISQVKRRCCLMSSYITLKRTVEYLNNNNYHLPSREIECPYSGLNNMCAKENCSFYHKA